MTTKKNVFEQIERRVKKRKLETPAHAVPSHERLNLSLCVFVSELFFHRKNFLHHPLCISFFLTCVCVCCVLVGPLCARNSRLFHATVRVIIKTHFIAVAMREYVLIFSGSGSSSSILSMKVLSSNGHWSRMCITPPCPQFTCVCGSGRPRNQMVLDKMTTT